jgi:hypothetical protein
MKSRLDLGFVAQPRNRPPTSSCCCCHHAARTRPRWPPGPSNEAYLSSPHLEASPTTTFRACSSPVPTRVKPQPAPVILSQESVHTTSSITHHTRKRPSTGPRTTHGPQTWKAKSIHYLKQAYKHVSLVRKLPNTAVQPIQVLWRRNKY